jgi:hypothetical protein
MGRPGLGRPALVLVCSGKGRRQGMGLDELATWHLPPVATRFSDLGALGVYIYGGRRVLFQPVQQHHDVASQRHTVHGGNFRRAPGTLGHSYFRRRMGLSWVSGEELHPAKREFDSFALNSAHDRRCSASRFPPWCRHGADVI